MQSRNRPERSLSRDFVVQQSYDFRSRPTGETDDQSMSPGQRGPYDRVVEDDNEGGGDGGEDDDDDDDDRRDRDRGDYSYGGAGDGYRDAYDHIGGGDHERGAYDHDRGVYDLHGAYNLRGALGVLDRNHGNLDRGYARQLVRSHVRDMGVYADRMLQLERAADGLTGDAATVLDRDQLRDEEGQRRRARQLLLDHLVDMAHVAHGYLRHNDPDVRDAAELLTAGTACLIGRVYAKLAEGGGGDWR